ncbi:MAG: phosphotransferase, partial [Gemmatimonadetes bacterium]|nr:phosphotransferase [Gemmatimonadota bacterium]
LPVVDHVRIRPVGDRYGILQERLAALEQSGLVSLADRVRDRFRAEAHPGRAPRADTLVHGDLYARHLLVDDRGALTGVIDWGDVHVGDPALDLMTAFTMIPPVARTGFLEDYGAVTSGTLAEARRWGLFHATTVAWYGESTGDGDLRREGLWSLEQALAD